MDKSWMQKITMSEEQRKDLEHWCERIGYRRYEQIYKMISNCSPQCLNYETMSAIARYDFDISDFLHSTIKFVELNFRSFLSNRFGDTPITKKEYLYEISEALNGSSLKLDCTTYYDKTLKDQTTLAEFLDASGMETLFRLVLILDDKMLIEFGPREQLIKDLEMIRRLRNHVAHGQLIVNNPKLNLKEAIVALFRYMPTEESKNKRIKILNDLQRRVLVEEGHLPQNLISIISVI